MLSATSGAAVKTHQLATLSLTTAALLDGQVRLVNALASRVEAAQFHAQASDARTTAAASLSVRTRTKTAQESELAAQATKSVRGATAASTGGAGVAAAKNISTMTTQFSPQLSCLLVDARGDPMLSNQLAQRSPAAVNLEETS